jgi:tetratricopeptide (TPR) repeat protein
VLYNLGDYDQAVALFRESYELSREPALLFNIAQAYRLKGDCSHALEAYRHFVRLAPKSPTTKNAETHMSHLEAQCGQASVAEATPPAARRAALPIATASRAARPVSRGVWVSLIVAGAAFGSAGYFGYEAHRLGQEASAAGMFDPEADAHGQRAELVEWASLGVGAVAVTAAAWFWLSPRAAKAAPVVTVLPLARQQGQVEGAAVRVSLRIP